MLNDVRRHFFLQHHHITKPLKASLLRGNHIVTEELLECPCGFHRELTAQDYHREPYSFYFIVFFPHHAAPGWPIY